MTYLFWNFTHTLRDCWKYPRIFWEIVLTVCPAVFFLAACGCDAPKWCKWIVGLFLLQLLIFPQYHYFIPALPFLILMSLYGMEKFHPRHQRSIFMTIVVLSTLAIPTFGRMVLGLARPVGLLHWVALPFPHSSSVGPMRPVTIFDLDMIAKQIKAISPLTPPVWCNWPLMYFALGIPAFNRDINNLDEAYSLIDWTKLPYSTVKTRLEFVSLFSRPTISGKTIVLDRGPFKEVVIDDRL